MVAEELDLPAEPQLPELPRPPLAAPSSKLELLRSVSASGCSAPCSAAPYIPALNRSYSRPPPAAACRCAANSGRCCRCRGLQRTRTSICSDVDGSVPPRDVQHARAGLAQFVSTCREQRQRTGFWRARPTATRWSALPRRPHSSTPVRAPTGHAPCASCAGGGDVRPRRRAWAGCRGSARGGAASCAGYARARGGQLLRRGAATKATRTRLGRRAGAAARASAGASPGTTHVPAMRSAAELWDTDC